MPGRLLDWLGQGVAADRPAAADVASLAGLGIPAGSCVFYFSKDTSILNVYDEDAVAWFSIDAAALAALSFATLPDVDWSTPPTDGQIFEWDTVSSKLIPVDKPLNWTTETIQDLVGAMGVNGIGTTFSYDDGAGTFKFDCTITQYTDANADARIAAASIADLSDVHTLAGIANGQVLMWSTANSRFEFGTPSTVGGLDDLSDVDTTTTPPADGQALIWDAGGSEWIPGDVAAGGSGSVEVFTPTVPVAADFSTIRNGLLPAPTIADVAQGNGVKLTYVRNSVGASWRQGYVLKSVPGGVPFRAEALMVSPWHTSNNWHMEGLAIGSTDAADLTRHIRQTVYMDGNQTFPKALKTTGLDTVEVDVTTINQPNGVASLDSLFWMAIEWDGTNINTYASLDGRTWWNNGVEPDTFFTGNPDLVGFGFEAVSSDGGLTLAGVRIFTSRLISASRWV